MKDKEKILKELASLCKSNRLNKNITLEQIAIETNYTKENIVRFERGFNNNLFIFLTYLKMEIISYENIKDIL